MTESQSMMEIFLESRSRLSPHQQIVYDAIAATSEKCNSELAEFLHRPTQYVEKRVAELKELGIIRIAGTKRDETTGYKAQYYEAIA